LIVVDTSAPLVILNKEPEHQHFLNVLAREERPLVSAVTFYEALLVLTARRGPSSAEDLMQLIEVAEAKIVPFDEAQAIAAVQTYKIYGKGIHPNARLNLCDCVAPALSKSLNVLLLFKGEDFAATDVLKAT
jgi:ribonuclease VapC